MNRVHDPQDSPKLAAGLRRSCVVAALLAAGCVQGKLEAQKAAAAIDDYRRAKGDSEVLVAARALRSAECARDDVCQAKAACLATADPMVQAIEKKVQVARELAQLGSGAPPPSSLATQLDQADALLAESRAALPLCAKRYDELRARYGLTAP